MPPNVYRFERRSQRAGRRTRKRNAARRRPKGPPPWLPLAALVAFGAIAVVLFDEGFRSWTFTQSGAAGPALEGRASVIDGDTIEIRGERVRFNGIDAPESRQLCRDGGGRAYRCGAVAANALARFLSASSPTRCNYVNRDRYGRFVGDCYRADGRSVASWLVRSGHALDWPRYSGGKYARQERAAKAERAGIWQGTFERPWEWRRRN
nr:thermonuclease family protein [Hongsoonwoonella zoysiae]